MSSATSWDFNLSPNQLDSILLLQKCLTTHQFSNYNSTSNNDISNNNISIDSPTEQVVVLENVNAHSAPISKRDDDNSKSAEQVVVIKQLDSLMPSGDKVIDSGQAFYHWWTSHGMDREISLVMLGDSSIFSGDADSESACSEEEQQLIARLLMMGGSDFKNGALIRENDSKSNNGHAGDNNNGSSGGGATRYDENSLMLIFLTNFIQQNQNNNNNLKNTSIEKDKNNNSGGEISNSELFRAGLSALNATSLTSLNQLLSTSSSVSSLLQKLLQDRNEIHSLTEGILSSCRELVRSQSLRTRWLSLVSERLEFFKRYDSLADEIMMQQPDDYSSLSGNIQGGGSNGRSLQDMVRELDECINFLKHKMYYREAELYVMRYKQLLGKCFTSAKVQVCTLFNMTCEAWKQAFISMEEFSSHNNNSSSNSNNGSNSSFSHQMSVIKMKSLLSSDQTDRTHQSVIESCLNLLLLYCRSTNYSSSSGRRSTGAKNSISPSATSSAPSYYPEYRFLLGDCEEAYLRCRVEMTQAWLLDRIIRRQRDATEKTSSSSTGLSWSSFIESHRQAAHEIASFIEIEMDLYNSFFQLSPTALLLQQALPSPTSPDDVLTRPSEWMERLVKVWLDFVKSSTVSISSIPVLSTLCDIYSEYVSKSTNSECCISVMNQIVQKLKTRLLFKTQTFYESSINRKGVSPSALQASLINRPNIPYQLEEQVSLSDLLFCREEWSPLKEGESTSKSDGRKSMVDPLLLDCIFICANLKDRVDNLVYKDIAIKQMLQPQLESILRHLNNLIILSFETGSGKQDFSATLDSIWKCLCHWQSQAILMRKLLLPSSGGERLSTDDNDSESPNSRPSLLFSGGDAGTAGDNNSITSPARNGDFWTDSFRELTSPIREDDDDDYNQDSQLKNGREAEEAGSSSEAIVLVALENDLIELVLDFLKREFNLRQGGSKESSVTPQSILEHRRQGCEAFIKQPANLLNWEKIEERLISRCQ